MAHEIMERHGSLDDLVLVGLQTGGLPFCDVLGLELDAISGHAVPRGSLDVAFYRDDVGLHPVVEPASTTLDIDLTDRVVIIVDDVLYTGRTVRAALNALSDWGRARAIELAVMVDRGHRELPIRPDYVGKNLPTARHEAIDANIDGVWIGELVAK
jgi:pyrimidine operon attenuation protein/uracil phosphoribosyltransferase